MNFFKSNLVSYLVPKNLNFLWNFGFLLGISFVVQSLSGIFLTMNFKAGERLSFKSLRDLFTEENFGWLIRFLHSNGVSFYFTMMFLHVMKGYFYSTKFLHSSWYSGLVVMLLSIVEAFLGYILPEGQMSYWGSVVIQNLMKWSGRFCTLIFGADTICEATYKRFMIYHYVIPLIIGVILIFHIFYLHRDSSTHTLTFSDIKQGVKFFLKEVYKDIEQNFALVLFICIQVGFGYSDVFQADPDNSFVANPMITPFHIVPEWYLLVFYATLKVMPTKVSGLLAIVVVLELVTLLTESRAASPFLPVISFHRCWTLVGNTFLCIVCIIGYVGQMVINAGLSLFGISMLYYVVKFVSKMLDTSRLRSFA